MKILHKVEKNHSKWVETVNVKILQLSIFHVGIDNFFMFSHLVVLYGADIIEHKAAGEGVGVADEAGRHEDEEGRGEDAPPPPLLALP